MNNIPIEVYSKLDQVVEKIIQHLNNNVTNSEFTNAQDEARKLLVELRKKISLGVDELKKYSEWNKFTVAFYGETNAGKSTIIETLRILLKESSKVSNQTQFKKLSEQYNGLEKSLECNQLQIEQQQTLLLEAEQMISKLSMEFQNQIERFDFEIENLKRQIHLEKKKMSFWQKIIFFFKKFPQEIDLIDKEKQFLDFKQEQNGINPEWALKKQNIVKSIEKLTTDNHQYKSQQKQILDSLEQYVDGQIIGDGQSDYTKHNTSYHFNLDNNMQLTLLDVPGIEGNESIVYEPIIEAVKKAHAVFYITTKPTPPQTGDAQNKGTLEKIAEHLGAQTEVWTIFNKRVMNVMSLRKGALVSQEETESLQDLDMTMKSVLGENYRRTITVSAYPAYMASSVCLLPGSKAVKSQRKFLDVLSRKELLQISGFLTLIQELQANIVTDLRPKIYKSNLNKISVLLDQTAEEVNVIEKERIIPLLQTVKLEIDSTHRQFDYKVKSFRLQLENEARSLVANFKEKVLKLIYQRIDEDISNGDFKAVLESILSDEQDKLVHELKSCFDKRFTDFEADIKQTMQRVQERLSESFELNNTSSVASFGNFKLNVKLDNGLNMGGLLTTLLGGGLMIWNPVGWVVTAISAIALLVGVYSAVRKFLSKDYKKSEQRQSAEKNIQGICNHINAEMEKNIDLLIKQVGMNVLEVKNLLHPILQGLFDLENILNDSQKHIKKISRQIKEEIVNVSKNH